MKQHTLGLAKISRFEGPCYQIICAEDGGLICQTTCKCIGCEANATRLMTLWNALEGVDTDDIDEAVQMGLDSWNTEASVVDVPEDEIGENSRGECI